MNKDRDRLAWEIELDEIPEDIDDAMTEALEGFKRQGDATVWAVAGFHGDIYVKMTVVGTKAVLRGYQNDGMCTHMGEKRLNVTYGSLTKHYPGAKGRFIGTRPLDL